MKENREKGQNINPNSPRKTRSARKQGSSAVPNKTTDSPLAYPAVRVGKVPVSKKKGTGTIVKNAPTHTPLTLQTSLDSKSNSNATGSDQHEGPSRTGQNKGRRPKKRQKTTEKDTKYHEPKSDPADESDIEDEGEMTPPSARKKTRRKVKEGEKDTPFDPKIIIEEEDK